MYHVTFVIEKKQTHFRYRLPGRAKHDTVLTIQE